MIKFFEPSIDLSELLKLRSEIEGTVEEQAFFNWPEPVLLQELQMAKVWISRDPQTAILNGFLVFRESDDRFEIMVLGTAPEFKRRGVMRGLLSQLQALAAQQNRLIGLEVHEKNGAARRFYVSLGFELSHRRKNYYKDGASAEVYLWKSQI